MGNTVQRGIEMAYGFNDNKSKVEVLPKSFWTPKRPTYKSNLVSGATLEMVQVGYIVFGTIKFTGVVNTDINMDGTNLPKPSSLITNMGFSDNKHTLLIVPIIPGYYYPRLLITSDINTTSGTVSFAYPVDAS